MATHISAVKNSNSASGTTLSITSVSVTAGDAIFVASKWESGTSTVTITDNASGGTNTYTPQGSVITDGSYGLYHYAIAKATETLTITQTLGTARDWRSVIVHVARPEAGTTFAYDNGSSATSGGGEPVTNNSAGTYDVAGVGGYAFFSIGEYSIVTYTPGTGWTEAIDDVAWSGYRILTNETSITAYATSSPAQNYVAGSIAVKEVGASGQPTSKRFGGIPFASQNRQSSYRW